MARDELEPFSPDRSSIKDFTRASSALFLPSLPKLIRIGTGFDSSRIGDSPVEPWKSSIFEESIGRDNKACVIDMTGTQSSYRQSHDASTRDKSEHFSASLGITIGNAFLSGSVSGSYDKAVSDIEQVKRSRYPGLRVKEADYLKGTRTSRTVTSRLGRILLRHIVPGPAVSQISFKMGSDDFKQRFGGECGIGF